MAVEIGKKYRVDGTNYIGIATKFKSGEVIYGPREAACTLKILEPKKEIGRFITVVIYDLIPL